MIDPKLQTFMNLCETKSYTKTAEILYITQPSVTHHIKTLEKMYSVKLFTSNSKNFKLTKQGELLYNYALQLIAFDNEFERLLASSSNANHNITFSATPNVMSAYLGTVIPEWSLANKDLVYKIKVQGFEDISKDLQEGKIDFAVVDNTFTKKNFQALPLHKTKLLVGTDPNSLLSLNKKINFDTLIKERLIFSPSNTGKREFIDNELKFKNRNFKEIKNIIEVDDPKLIVDLVSAGAGVSIFYESEISDYIKQGKIVPIEMFELKNSAEFMLIYNKNHPASKLIESIAMEFMKLYKEINYLKYSASFK